ncbi:hypothetical protein HX021_15400 [Sphingobacterium sp. N143]|uniref:hypothetical protein n=1 Tax=Sphingobacterium sp. N143 TaxID=2746727 RepID=UPI0025769B1B|nr:hypothetical protein [Sphingobacterium sp. N143]MDM1295677.1 hypothetical protein [Sphingobacterium sp. N143]
MKHIDLFERYKTKINKDFRSKRLYLFVFILIFTGCSKDGGYGPYNLKNGQEVEVSVSHRYGAVNDDLLLVPKNRPAEMSLYYFEDREPGFIYRVKAKMVAPEEPPQDGPSYYLTYIKTLDKKKYEGTESFELELIQTYIPGGPMIVLSKENGKYLFSSGIQLTYKDTNIENQLAEIWKNSEEVRHNATYPKWKSIRVTVSHDPDYFGKAYLIHGLKLTE